MWPVLWSALWHTHHQDNTHQTAWCDWCFVKYKASIYGKLWILSFINWTNPWTRTRGCRGFNYIQSLVKFSGNKLIFSFQFRIQMLHGHQQWVSWIISLTFHWHHVDTSFTFPGVFSMTFARDLSWIQLLCACSMQRLFFLVFVVFVFAVWLNHRTQLCQETPRPFPQYQTSTVNFKPVTSPALWCAHCQSTTQKTVWCNCWFVIFKDFHLLWVVIPSFI